MKHPLIVYKSSAGTGKTFTLAAYYVSLLMRGENYRSLLAVTFTNKATAEMKERILAHLYILGQCASHPEWREDEAGFVNKVREFIAEAGCPTPSDHDIYLRAAALYPKMIEDYGGICITTIDSFLQTLFGGLAQALQTAAGYEVDLDSTHAISVAVDELMTTELTQHEGLKQAVMDYVGAKMDNEESWDIRTSLCDLARQLFQEQLQEHRDAVEHFDMQLLTRLRDAFAWRELPEVQQLQALAEGLQAQASSIAGITGGTFYCSFVKRFCLSLSGKIKKDDWFKPLSARETARFDKPTKDAVVQGWYASLRQLNDACARLRTMALKAECSTAYLADMILLKYIRLQISADLSETGAVLLADTAHLLREALRPGDADFILEKVGLRYKHVMLDEFQDTSRMQWANFLPLVQEVLGSGGTVLIVGDIKQSIYRWRNGDWHIMQDLATGDLAPYLQEKQLVRSFRTTGAIVEHNLQAMQALTQGEKAEGAPLPAIGEASMQSIYSEGYQGDAAPFFHKQSPQGYVRFRAYAQPYQGAAIKQLTSDHLIADLFTQIASLLEAGAKPSDCLILCRKKKNEVPAIIRWFDAHHTEFPALRGVGLASTDSFLLSASPSVLTIVSALRYLFLGDSAALLYAQLHGCHPHLRQALEGLNLHAPLMEITERIVELALCRDGLFQGKDLAYLNSLKDQMRAFISRYGSNAEAFLQYFDDCMGTKPVAASSGDAIRIMSVHAAKGLEGRYVFIPFCDWKMERDGELLWCHPEVADEQLHATIIPIKDFTTLDETPYAPAHQQERREQRVDNMNILYVALTRPKEGLYLWMKQTVSKKEPRLGNNVGTLLLHHHGKAEALLETYDAADFAAEEPEPVYVEWNIGTNPLEALEAAKKASGASSAEGSVGESASAAAKKESSAAPEPPFVDISSPEAAIKATYHSENHDIRFVQSQDSTLYYEGGHRRGKITAESIAFGNICHDILAEVSTADDLPRVLRSFRLRGIIDSDAMQARVEEQVRSAWKQPQMAEWFSGQYDLMREDAILVREGNEVKEYRPDRVMLRGSEAIILDYKFGQRHPEKYAEQLQGYIRLLQGLGYTSVRAYLWYAHFHELVEVTL